MRAARLRAGRMEVVDVADPDEGIVARPTAVGICGTDLTFTKFGDLPFTLGHELVVDVDGTAYAVEPTLGCGTCEQCRSGHDNRCTNGLRILGVSEDGGLAERLAVPSASQLTPLPDGLGPADASLVETLAVVHRGLRKAPLDAGVPVAVVGGGSIGLATVAALRAAGHPAHLEARHPHQVAAGERLGAVAPTAAGTYDVVVDAAGSESGLARCLDLVRPGGRVVLLGLYLDTLPVSAPVLITKEVELVPSAMYGVDADGAREFATAAAVLAAAPDVADTLITHRFPLEDVAEAFRVAADRASGAIKVVIEPT